MLLESLQILRLFMSLFVSNAIIYTILFLAPDDEKWRLCVWWSLTLASTAFYGAVVYAVAVTDRNERIRDDMKQQELARLLCNNKLAEDKEQEKHRENGM